MSAAAVARNYAETLLALARREGAEADEWVAGVESVARLLDEEPRLRAFIRAPGIPAEEKRRAVREAVGEGWPELLVRFLLVTLEKRRFALLPEIAGACRELLDTEAGRERATVTLAHEPDEALCREIEGALGRALDREVIADYRQDPAIVGGMVIRVKDRVMDGSLRRRMQLLRRALLEGRAPARAGGVD